MIKIKIKQNLASILEDVYDFDTETTYKGTEYVVVSDELLHQLEAGNCLFPLHSMGLSDEFGIMEIFAQIDSTLLDPIHESWIEAIEVDGELYTLNHTEPWSSSTHLRLTKAHHFFDIATQTVTFNDNCCIECGSSLSTPTPDSLCNSCVDKLTRLENYSFKPTPVFQSIPDETTEEFYGIELEYGFRKKRQAAAFVQKHRSTLYLKSDSSIGGGEFRAEVVTHPHSFKKLMSSDSFLADIDALKVEHSNSNGCHVHISRAAFKTRKHYTLFYFLLHSSQQLLEYIGGRPLNSYCEFRPVGEVHTKENARDTSQTRGRVVNETNQTTVEVRIFNSTNKASEVKRYVQFLDSLIQYSKTDKNTVSLKKYFDFVKVNKTTYPELQEHLAAFSAIDAKGFRFRDPIITEYLIEKINLSSLCLVSEIILKNGNKYLVHPNGNININRQNQTLEVATKTNDGDYTTSRIKLKEIEKLKVVK